MTVDGATRSLESAGRIVTFPVSQLVPMHEVRTPRKVADLIASIESGGWRGPPLVGIWIADSVQLLTGAHRYAASAELELDEVPVVLLNDLELASAQASGFWDGAYDRPTDTVELGRAMRRDGHAEIAALLLDDARR